jgi:hypothetical protein
MEDLLCPACGDSIRPDSRGGLHCTGCGAVLASPFTLCPRCSRVNDTGAETCTQCGGELQAVCPACGRINWSGTDRCEKCGRELDFLAHAFRTIDTSFRLRQEELRRRASFLREEGEIESRARLDMLREADRRRMERHADAAERARRRQRRIVIGTAAVVIAFFVLLILVMLLIAGAGPSAIGG